MDNITTNADLKDRLVIVTGASSGVGYATVRRLAQLEGFTVVAVGRRRMFRIESLAAHVGGGRIIPMTADMSVRSQAEALVENITERLGTIHGFIHAVHRVVKLPALDVSDAEFDLTMQVNVKSALYGVQSVAPNMRDQQYGAIVIYNPMPITTEAFVASEAVYTAGSHALSALAAGWTRQLSTNNVIVREIAPEVEDIRLQELRTPHDQLLVQALQNCLDDSEAQTQENETYPVMEMSPKRIVLTERGGLALTWF